MKKEINKEKINIRKIRIFVLCLIAVYLIAFLGSLFTTNSVNSSWYEQNKPSLTPPNFIFPIVWNILFFLIAISLYLTWISSKTKKQKASIFAFF